MGGCPATAAANGQTAIFDLLIQRGADVNRRDDEGGTPLIRAIMPYFKDKPRLGMIDKLLAKGADLNLGTENPGVKEGAPSALKAVMIGGISGGSSDNAPSDADAARKLVAKLLNHGARFPVTKDSDAEHMLIAAAAGELETVQKLLARGVSPDVSDTKGWTPLMSASALGYSEIMRILIDAGANVSARDAAGLTPLWLAISSNPNAADIQLLLNKGADPNANADFFGTALIMAINRNDVDLVRDLLKRTANPNACRNIHRESHAPIHVSVCGEHTNPEIAKLLLQYGADPNPKCSENRSPLYWAINHQQTETVRELLKAGADPRKTDNYKKSISQAADDCDNQEIKSMIKAALGKKEIPKSSKSVAGTVIGPDGKPVDGARVTAGDQTQKSTAKPEAKTVIIHVLDSDGAPLSGASAKAEGPNISIDVMTGSDGLATISLPTARPQYLTVRVRKNGYVPKIIYWSLDQPSFSLPGDFTLKMERAQSIGGVVKNDDGQAVKGAKVVLIIRGSSMGVSQEVFDDLWERRVTTDKDGKWHFDEAPSDLRSLSVKLEHPDYISNAHIDPRPSDADFKNQKAVLIAHRGTPVEGTVTDESGKPLPGIEVTFGEITDSTSYPSTKTDAAGHFHFGALSLVKKYGRILPILTFTSPNYAPEMVELKPLATPQTLRVQLKVGKPLRVRFTDQQGHPIQGVIVAADYWRKHRPFGCIRFTSDGDGKIVWDHAPDEPITYAVMGDSIQRQDMIFQPKDAVQTIQLKRPTVVTGHVVDATTKQPIPGFDLIVGTYFPTMHPFWSSWARGAALHIKGVSYRYVFEGPAMMGSAVDGLGTEGFHRIRIEAPGYEPAVSRPLANDEETVSIDFELKPAPAIHGVVIASDGTPVKGAQIVVAGPGNALQIVNGVSQSKWNQLSVYTDDQGKYNLPPQEEDFPIAIIQPQAGYLTTTYSVLKSAPNAKLLSWGELRLATGVPNDTKPQYYLRYVHKDEAAYEKERICFEVDKPNEVQNGVAIYKQLVAGPMKIIKPSQDINKGQAIQIENGKTTKANLNLGRN
ncbi:MAG: ankyrin repeat domain-containing protein [Chthoniobacteraceae bacterium]